MFLASIVCLLLGADPSFTEIDQEISEGRRTKNGTNVYTSMKLEPSITANKYRSHSIAITSKNGPADLMFSYMEYLNQDVSNFVGITVIIPKGGKVDEISNYGKFPLRILCGNEIVQCEVSEHIPASINSNESFHIVVDASKLAKAFKDPTKSIDYRFADLEIKPSREVNKQVREFLEGLGSFKDAVNRK